MRVAFVVQRYGPVITGGAEQLCRQVAEQLADDFEIDVLTTTAKDYTLWRNYYVPGRERHKGVTVRRFPIERRNNPWLFRWQTRFLFHLPHTRNQELKWIEAQGPYAPALIDYLRENHERYDLIVFFSYRYYPTFFGVRAVADKSVLAPTAEHDRTIYLESYREFFRLPRGFIFLTDEESELVRSVCPSASSNATVAGVGIETPGNLKHESFRRAYPMVGRYILYLGRIHQNKGCREMFEFMEQYYADNPESDVQLVLVGARAMDIPKHPNILHVGFLSEQEKFDALFDSELLIMPSRFESLSMVTLEAMAVGRPVVVNGHCEVLAGHCRRSGAGLTYCDYGEFTRALDELLCDDERQQRMGEAGSRYVAEYYSWPVVRERYRDFLTSMIEQRAG